ncbi:hypothetical protein BH24BAC1_BH24BAC1_11170 [soil metagenome]|jgi:hypothetical protein
MENSRNDNLGDSTSYGDPYGGTGSSGGAFNSGDSSRGESRMVTGMFRDRESAEKAYNAMHQRGYTKDDVNLVMSDEARKRHFASDRRADDDTVVTDRDNDTELGNKALEGTGVGSAIGGTVGAVIGAIAAIGTSVALPGLGLVIAGPLAAGLAGAGAGGLTGGVVGALVGSGIPEERAEIYDKGIREGHIVMAVRPRSEEDAEYLEQEWKNSRGEEIYR